MACWCRDTNVTAFALFVNCYLLTQTISIEVVKRKHERPRVKIQEKTTIVTKCGTIV